MLRKLDLVFPELDNEFFRVARPASMVPPPDFYAGLAAPERESIRGKQQSKFRSILPMEQDVFESLLESGRDWQARADKALRRLVERWSCLAGHRLPAVTSPLSPGCCSTPPAASGNPGGLQA